MNSHRFPAIALAATLAALAACGGEKSPNSSSAASTRDIALTPQPSSSQPQLHDGPAPAKSATTQKSTTKAPTKSASSNAPGNAPASAPASAPAAAAAPEAKFGLIPVGTTLGVRTTAKLCTNSSKVGDHV